MTSSICSSVIPIDLLKHYTINIEDYITFM